MRRATDLRSGSQGGVRGRSARESRCICFVQASLAAVAVIVAMIAVMAVAPSPVLSLLLLVATVIVPVTAMRLDFPLLVIHAFVVIPSVVVVALIVVDARGATRYHHRGNQSCTQHEGPKVSAHSVSPFLAGYSDLLHLARCKNRPALWLTQHGVAGPAPESPAGQPPGGLCSGLFI
jgi:hypothetical protein